MKIDLHLHSNCSDGLLSPQDLVDLAKKSKYEIVSITDHDNIDFYSSFNYLEEKNIKIIPGIEISTMYKNREIHILAYFLDFKNANLLQMINFLKESRIERAKEILKNLKNHYNIDINYENLLEYTGKEENIGRPHIANAIYKKAHASTYQKSFDNFLSESSKAYVPKITYPFKKVLEIISEAKGISILAHPFRIGSDDYVVELIKMGLDGIETYYAKHSKKKVKIYENMVNQYNLISTGGSDFHGFDKIYFGKYSMPEICYYKLMELKNKRG